MLGLLHAQVSNMGTAPSVQCHQRSTEVEQALFAPAIAW